MPLQMTVDSGDESPRHSRSAEKGTERDEKKASRLVVDRQKTCPMLVRLFCKNNSFHRLEEFVDKQPVDDELVIYTWKDATLKELTALIKQVHEECRHAECKFQFRFSCLF